MNIKPVSAMYNVHFGAKLSNSLLEKHKNTINGNSAQEQKSEEVLARLDKILPGYEIRTGREIKSQIFNPPYDVIRPLELVKETQGEQSDTIRLQGFDKVTGDWLITDDMSVSNLENIANILESKYGENN